LGKQSYREPVSAMAANSPKAISNGNLPAAPGFARDFG